MTSGLKRLRRMAGYKSVKALAEDTGMSASYLHKIEQGLKTEKPWLRKYLYMVLRERSRQESESD